MPKRLENSTETDLSEEGSSDLRSADQDTRRERDSFNPHGESISFHQFITHPPLRNARAEHRSNGFVRRGLFRSKSSDASAYSKRLATIMAEFRARQQLRLSRSTSTSTTSAPTPPPKTERELAKLYLEQRARENQKEKDDRRLFDAQNRPSNNWQSGDPRPSFAWSGR